ncbi:MAG: carbon monoxide dehydrogenase [Gammaproteobacteria bacterium HGW-Gammaproteobacteria-3]|nr:MAG: carbon monoxide dehydrogenase [Gammaproteobacteria bacterium HGW-Gammaproteobacteria-3]
MTARNPSTAFLPLIGEQLQSRLVEFVRLARSNGFCAGVAEEIDAQRIALFCNVLNITRLHWGLRSLLCSNQDDWERFNELFDAYWRPGKVRSQYQPVSGALTPGNTAKSRGRQPVDKVNEVDLGGESDLRDAGKNGTRGGAGYHENLLRMDFRFISDDSQMRAFERLAERLARKMHRRFKRREKIHQQGRRIHLRRTLRNSLRFGGMPMELAYNRKYKRQPRLLLIVDVSRSMSMYSSVFLRFAQGMINAFSDADAFAYHTRLVHISHAMRQTDYVKLQHSLALISQGWSGGTRIGECLRDFNQNYGRRLNSHTVVVMLSDGLDTGPAGQLAQELAKIKQRCRKLVWLNPLLGRPGYETKTAGMLAALPFVDLLAPAHNLQSLAALETALINL